MPELWSSGYAAFFPAGNPAGLNDSAYFEWMDSATALDGEFVRHFQRYVCNSIGISHGDLEATSLVPRDSLHRLAVELDLAIGATYLERNEDGATPPRNSIAMIDRHGRVLYNYQKVHVCSFA